MSLYSDDPNQHTDGYLTRVLQENIMQMAFSASMLAEGLATVTQDPTTHDYLGQLARLNRGILAELRNLFLHLELDSANGFYLPIQLDYILAAVRATSNMDISLVTEAQHVPEAEIQQAFFRVALLAIYDLNQRSQARWVNVTLRAEQDFAKLTIRADRIATDGNVWPRMSHYADRIGGQLAYVSVPDTPQIRLVWYSDGPYGPSETPQVIVE